VAGVVPRVADALLREAINPVLGKLFILLWTVLSQWAAPCCVIHLRSHQWDLGLGHGNQIADNLVSPACPMPRVDKFQQARQSHENFQQNAKGLRRQFGLTENEARYIVQACPKCGNQGPGIGQGGKSKRTAGTCAMADGCYTHPRIWATEVHACYNRHLFKNDMGYCFTWGESTTCL